MDFFSARINSPTLKNLFSTGNLEKTHAWFNKHGLLAVLFSRFSAGIRFFVAIVAGMVRMNIVLFISAFTIATVLWNTILISGGYLLGQSWEEMLHYIRIYSGFVAVVMFLGIIIFLYSYLKKNKV
jgi:membrane protein DedA with SNARE-associated domain